jgi:hypothetical protein
VPRLVCREIEQTDIAAVATLLAREFPSRTHQFWLLALAQLSRREPPPGLPKYGYLLDCDGALVGAILLICSTVREEAVRTRCNFSSWCVAPNYRPYASLLVSKALAHKDVTYVNISPAPHTLRILEAQGFIRYSHGVFIAVPIIASHYGARIKVANSRREPDVSFDPVDQQTLSDHAAFGCISLWCEMPNRAYPFIFRRRLLKGALPCAQMIYCQNINDFVRFAGPIGRFLAMRGLFFVIIDASGPIPGLVGTFRKGIMPKYFKGRDQPRLGDLAYSEAALFDF